MNRILVTFTLILFGILVVAVPNTFAHVLKADGTIGAVMHIQPEDDPVAGEESSFFFEFKDKKNTFNPKVCDCTFSILSNGQEIYSQPLFQNNAEPSLTNASVFYKFPSRGIYTVRITGKPLAAEVFEPFTLEFIQRVERTSGSQSNIKTNWFIEHIPHFIGGIIGFSVLGFIVIKQHRRVKQ